MKTIITVATAALAFGLVASPSSAKELKPSAKEYLEKLVNEKFANVILMTDQNCSDFGEGWTNYVPMNGRFPVAAGSGTDDRGESKAFVAHDRGGEYQHQITISEMPSHRHKYHDSGKDNTQIDKIKELRGFEGKTWHDYHDYTRRTDTVGNGQPHNNMPPYLAVNFCWQSDR